MVASPNVGCFLRLKEAGIKRVKTEKSRYAKVAYFSPRQVRFGSRVPNEPYPLVSDGLG